VCHLAGDEIGLIALGHGNQQVGVVQTGIGQYRRMRCVADDRLQVKAILQMRQPLMVAIDHRDIVVFRDEAFGDAGTDLASAENDDTHGC
jgi:hypothetical protein